MRSVKVLWGIVGILVIAVVVLAVLLIRSGGETAATGEPPKEPDNKAKQIAVIGDKTVTEEELQMRLLDRYGTEMLSLILDREAIRQEAASVGITVNRIEIDQELKRMMQGYESEQRFYQSMEEQLGLTRAELQEDVYYKLLLERLAIRNVRVTPSEIDAFIEEHPEEFKGFVQYNLLKIEVKTKEEAQRIVQEARGGADFAALAKTRSIDSATAKDGGDLGWIEEKDPFVTPSLLQAAQTLAVGEISGPIALEGTYAVLMMKAKKEVRKVVDNATRDRIRKDLALQKAPPLKEFVKTLREKWNATIYVPELR